MVALFEIAIAMVAGLLISRFIKPLKMPAVTGYLIAGILVGPYCLGQLGIPGVGFTDMASVKALDIISQVALGFIAFSIGNEFRLTSLKKTGKQATIIAIFQALTATLFVDAAQLAIYFIWGKDVVSVPMALSLGAIATATAPAATLMVVRRYKAKGSLTSILLPIVALDDAVGLVVFAISFGISKALINGSFSLVSVLVNPLLEVILSLVLGYAMGMLFTVVEKFFKSNSKRLSLSITFVILTVALSMLEYDIPNTDIKIGFSNLLVCMMLGTVFCNKCDFSEELMGKCDKWTAPLFVLFFVLSGAELELSVFKSVSIVIIGIVYIIARSAGKIIGASISAKATHCEPKICKYLGITLLPQAGVALGMSLTVSQELGEQGMLMRNIVLFGVLIYELVGPTLTKIALTKAGEIVPKTAPALKVVDDDEDD